MANGFFREDQAQRLGRLLDETARRGLFRVMMIHHPPVRDAVSQYKRLFGIGNFQKTVRRHGAELVLHGHSHEPRCTGFVGEGAAQVPVVGVAAAGQAVGGTHPAAQWNLLEISGEPGALGAAPHASRPVRADHSRRRDFHDRSVRAGAAGFVEKAS